MEPIAFKEQTCVLGKHQEEYKDLPAFMNELETISCWRLTWWDRVRLMVTGRLWLRQCNFSDSLQPQLPQIERPEFKPVGSKPTS